MDEISKKGKKWNPVPTTNGTITPTPTKAKFYKTSIKLFVTFPKLFATLYKYIITIVIIIAIILLYYI